MSWNLMASAIRRVIRGIRGGWHGTGRPCAFSMPCARPVWRTGIVTSTCGPVLAWSVMLLGFSLA